MHSLFNRSRIVFQAHFSFVARQSVASANACALKTGAKKYIIANNTHSHTLCALEISYNSRWAQSPHMGVWCCWLCCFTLFPRMHSVWSSKYCQYVVFTCTRTRARVEIFIFIWNLCCVHRVRLLNNARAANRRRNTHARAFSLPLSVCLYHVSYTAFVCKICISYIFHICMATCTGYRRETNSQSVVIRKQHTHTSSCAMCARRACAACICCCVCVCVCVDVRVIGNCPGKRLIIIGFPFCASATDCLTGAPVPGMCCMFVCLFCLVLCCVCSCAHERNPPHVQYYIRRSDDEELFIRTLALKRSRCSWFWQRTTRSREIANPDKKNKSKALQSEWTNEKQQQLQIHNCVWEPPQHHCNQETLWRVYYLCVCVEKIIFTRDSHHARPRPAVPNT